MNERKDEEKGKRWKKRRKKFEPNKNVIKPKKMVQVVRWQTHSECESWVFQQWLLWMNDNVLSFDEI